MNIKNNPWNLKFPPLLLHLGPVILALFCLTISLSGHSVYTGFNEKGPGTTLSLFFMTICFFLAFSAINNPEIDSRKRTLGIFTSIIIFLAILDEKFKFHEAFGRYVQNNLQISRKITYYTDDVVIILAAVIGGLILFNFVKKSKSMKEIYPYLWIVIILALGHGFLDLVSHKKYLWQIVWPEMNGSMFHELLGERLGCLEEWFKIWTEWFVILFLLRFFHKQKAPLIWTLQIFIGSIIATSGLWAYSNAYYKIPYVMAGNILGFIRNYHLLIGICIIWVTWSILTWLFFKDDKTKIKISGLLFLTPTYLLLHQIFKIDSIENVINFIADSKISILFDAGNTLSFLTFILLLLIIPFILVLFFRILLKSKLVYFFIFIVLLFVIYRPIGFNLNNIMNLVKLGGLLIAVSFFLIGKIPVKDTLILAITLILAVTMDTLIGIVVYITYFFFCSIDKVPIQSKFRNSKVLYSTLALNILVTLFIILSFFPKLISNEKFLVIEKRVLKTNYQYIIQKF